jgi:iron uptake system component EfeO
MPNIRSGLAPILLLAISACAPSPADLERDARRNVRDEITTQLTTLETAARDLQAAAPAADGDGWNATSDADAVMRMRAAWGRMRVAYEHVEGAIAVLFPELDRSIDARYDDFIATRPDTNLFDDQGVTGMHAVERILWSDAIPTHVTAFESGLPGYVAAAFPANASEASAFRDQLVQRMIDDAVQLRSQFGTVRELDSATAFRGVIGSMAEQVEKVDKAATSEEESRYAQYTLADMRANLDGAQRTFAAFRTWLVSVDGGNALAQQIDARFAALEAQYATLSGDALPPVPDGYNPDAPSPEQAASPYGMLRTTLVAESDPDHAGSIVALMNQAAMMMGIPVLP